LSKKLKNGTDFLEIAMTEMIYIGTNWSYRMQRYGATVVLTAIGWVEGRTDRHARRQIDRQAVRQTDIQRANRQTEKQKQI
jgi:hypothetical protein